MSLPSCGVTCTVPLSISGMGVQKQRVSFCTVGGGAGALPFSSSTDFTRLE